jgi:hypothetical protein
MSDRILDPFRGHFEDGLPRDPGHPWNIANPMSPELLERVLTEVLAERGVRSYTIKVSRDAG